MIAYIEGEVLHFSDTKVILKAANGIGYEIFYNEFAQVGSKLGIFTEQIIRETSQDLYGFKEAHSKDFFKLLLTVKGVGPKSAFSLLSSVGVDQLIQAIVLENKKIIQSAPGIGAKAAAQVILDLKDKVSAFGNAGKTSQFISSTPTNGNAALINESLQACTELGFKETEVLPIINKAIDEGAASSDQIVKTILKNIGI